MAGYVFDSAESILPYLEKPCTGPTSLFCKELASHLGCYVAAGYPERLDAEELIETSLPTLANDDQAMQHDPQIPNEQERKQLFEKEPHHTTNALISEDHAQNYVGANSAILYGPSGEWVGGYRKTNLFETDKSWAKPGKDILSPPHLLTVI